MNITTLLLLLIAAETTYLTVRQLKPSHTKIPSQSILLDTSVLIDGRIESIARSGLVTTPLIIPRSVVRELQYMADKADHEKRERARYGLDMIEKLQEIENLEVTVIEDGPMEDGGVDERLVTLAKSSNSRLCTTDYNLNKAARVQGVTVLNINEIAHALRIVRLPGEQVTIELQQPGQERDQAVGYLDDGTMVVVDNGRVHIGEAVPVEVTRVLQTVAGKMMFAKLVSAQQKQAPKKDFSGKAFNKKSLSQSTGEASMVVKTNSQASKLSMSNGSRVPKKPFKQTKSEPAASAPQKPTQVLSTPPVEVIPNSVPQSSKKPQKRGRKSMTDRAEDSLVDLLNKQ